MGNKAEAKRLMLKAKVPCVPGYEGEDQSDASLVKEGKKIGYPLMVKAAAGGGGRGMRLVEKAADLKNAIKLARSESENAFGSGELILEKAIIRPRHVEIQIIADEAGNTLYLGERDCSVQRRHQKVLEEAPCPIMTPALRQQMGEAAVKAAKSIKYTGAGTVEFLLDEEGEFYFLEMNTRLQVEHPVTEMVTGLDLVMLQIQVARGERLPISQEDVTLSGHAIEARIYAEDPVAGFLPSTGLIESWRAPSGVGVRVDDGVQTGQEISPFYDSMVAKVIAHGASREEALAHLHTALRHTVLFGPKSNTEFLLSCLEAPVFRDGMATTAFIADTFGEEGYTGRAPNEIDAAAGAALAFFLDQEEAWYKSKGVAYELLGWSNNTQLVSPYHLSNGAQEFLCKVSATGDQRVNVNITDTDFDVRLLANDDGVAEVRINNDKRLVHFQITDDNQLFLSIDGATFRFTNLLAEHTAGAAVSEGTVVSPMHGVVIDVFVKKGQKVKAGDRLAVLEAMKMQHELNAPIAGKLVAVSTSKGKQVAADDQLFDIE